MSTGPKQQLSIIGFSTFLALFSLAAIINFTDPTQASWITFGFFYVSLFLFFLGIFTLAGLSIRQWLAPGHYVKNLGSSFRQGFLASLLVSISFLLLADRLLFWWVEATLILLFVIIEVFLNLKI
ncbi:MAG: hypothetical protein P4L74_04870 [Candidatus Doudnabacteria bacterium]|nr:hypothetical protein [Candidatus Doudnabacteria bacterium]